MRADTNEWTPCGAPQGIQPGPQVMMNNPDLFWGLIASFWIGNVIVMAGVPTIMQAMLDEVGPKLKTGKQMLSESVRADTREGDIGTELQQLVRKPGLRTALRLMRAPARAAGLESLQGFLEAGFDAFGSMREPAVFMNAIRSREDGWIQRLFAADNEACANELTSIWNGEQHS